LKPEEHIIALTNAVTDPSRIQAGRERQVISLSRYPAPVCIIIHEGVISIFREKDHVMITNVSAPFIIGVNLLIEKNHDVYIQARGSIRYEVIARDEFVETLEQKDLWRNLSYVFMYNSKRFLEYSSLSVGVSTYAIVCNNLKRLMTEPENLRAKITACEYIKDKTQLSRSGIMKILSDLKLGGYISIERGILLDINKLPDKY
jgi:hypothetical protein